MTSISPLELKFRFVLGLICAVLFIAMVIFSTYKANQKAREFPGIDKDTQLSGIVKFAKKERSWVRVTFDNKIKRTIYSPPDLVDFIRSGDFLEKRVGTDSIYITRETKIYSFAN